MFQSVKPCIVINPNQGLDGTLVGRGYHVNIRVCDGWIERLHPRIIVCFPESLYLESLGAQGLALMRALFEAVDEIEEMYFYSHSVYVYTNKQADWEQVEPRVLAVLTALFLNPEKVEIVRTFDEALCHPSDTRNHKGLAPA